MSRMQALDKIKDLKIDSCARYSGTDLIAANNSDKAAQDIRNEKDLLALLMKLHYNTESKFKAL
jgi:hypothetical protein